MSVRGLVLSAVAAALLAPPAALAFVAIRLNRTDAAAGFIECEMGGWGNTVQPDLADCLATINTTCTYPAPCLAGCAIYLNGWAQQPACHVLYDDPPPPYGGTPLFTGIRLPVAAVVSSVVPDNVEACFDWCVDALVGLVGNQGNETVDNEKIRMCQLGCTEAKAKKEDRIEREEDAVASEEVMWAIIFGTTAGVIGCCVLGYLYLKPKCQLFCVKKTVAKKMDELQKAEDAKIKAKAEKAERKEQRKKNRAEIARRKVEEARLKAEARQKVLDQERERAARNDSKMDALLAEQKAERQAEAEADRKAAEAAAADAAARAQKYKDDMLALAAAKTAAEAAAADAADAAEAAKNADRLATAKAHQEKHSAGTDFSGDRGARQ